jgi:hypothetical protein
MHRIGTSESLPRSVVLLALVVFALGAAACGGDPSPSSSEPAVGEAFAKQAVAVCKDAVAAKDAQRPFPFPDFNPSRPDVSKLPIIATYLAETVRTFQGWLDGLKALGAPPSGREAWDDLVSAAEEHVRIATEQQQAAEQSDAATFIHDFEVGSTIVDRVKEAADAAGVPSCAQVDQ